MEYASSTFFKIGKKRKDIAQFLCIEFEAHLPGAEGECIRRYQGHKEQIR